MKFDLPRSMPQVLSVLRIVAALVFLLHGSQTLFGFPVPPAGGLPAEFSLVWIAAIFELAGAVHLLVGPVSRQVASIPGGIQPDPGLEAAMAQRHAAEERARHFLLHDPLTGLPNRVLLAERMEEAAARGGCAVLFFDLDRFQQVNDLHGHLAGDRLLAAVAGRLRPALRQSETLARLGGDQFAILLPQADRVAAGGAARRVVELIAQPFELEGRTHSIGASLGIALCPDHGLGGPDLLRAANAAMSRAKRCGKGTYAFYDAALGGAAMQQRSLENDLGQALARDEFRLAYQPICDAATGALEGFEALIRWQHPERGPVPPGQFIEISEQTGLIIPIGDWVLEAACAEAASWLRPLQIAVNVSPMQFVQPDFCPRLQALLDRYGLDARRLEIEVTEGLMLGEATVVQRNMRGLRQMGVRIALDDFGTGHASLSYLCRYPFDTLKIDRSFIQHLGDEVESRAIVASVMSLSRGLHLGVVAEGVETELQWRELQEMQCDRVQGWLFGKPMPASAARALVAGARPGPAPVPMRGSVRPALG